VPEAAFADGRPAILENFLSRTSLYGTDFFRAKYERQARENLRRSIRQLRQQTIA
jgi:predicted metal-dependent HD superfamily phosphohydrolase